MKKVQIAKSIENKALKNVAGKSKEITKQIKIEKDIQETVWKGISAIKDEKKEIIKPKTEVSNDSFADKCVKIEPDTKEVDAKVIAKIEKKKAKKLAQKLKKKEKKKNVMESVKSSDQQNDSPKDNNALANVRIDRKKDNPSKASKDLQSEKKDEKTSKARSEPDTVNDGNSGKHEGQLNGLYKGKGNLKPNAQQKSQKKDKKNKKKPKQEPEEGKEFLSSKDPKTAASTIFVGNLPVSTKRVQIAKIFAKLGGVRGIRLRTASGQVIFKHKQRKQAGSINAYVVLRDPDAAQKALELNGMELKGNHLRITPASVEKTKTGHDPKRTVFIGNLKYSANEKKLHEIFSNCGEIDYIRCLGNGKDGCKGVAFVCFKSPAAVGLALELNETLLDERPIHVERYSKKKLGAKEARDKQEIKKPQSNDAKKRVNRKQERRPKNATVDNLLGKKKKSDFHGVKATDINKKKHSKKQNNEMKGLAKKIAPKERKG